VLHRVSVAKVKAVEGYIPFKAAEVSRSVLSCLILLSIEDSKSEMRLSTSSLAKRAMRMCAYAFKLSARPSVLLRLRLMICSMRLSSSALQAGSETSASSLLSSSSIELVLCVCYLA
jgi:hypothetical protein